MKLLYSLTVLSAGVMFMLPNGDFCRGESNPDGKARPAIFGSWRAESVSMVLGDGKKLAYPSLFDNRPFNVIIADKSLALWRADEVFAEMSYDAGSQLTFSTIEGQYQDEGVLGIYELKGDQLKISMNNAGKGRPLNYDKNENDCVLFLHRFEGQPLMVMDADGGNLHALPAAPGYTTCGSPNWSPDGSKIAMDCWRSLLNESHTQSHVFVANSDGSSPKDLGDGALPSFSADGKQIAFYRYDQNAGVWVMKADGSDKHLIDKKGTCARWSPKNDELAYATENNLCIVDLKNDNSRMLLDKSYQRIVWGFGWSPDAKWICFKGILPGGGAETALVGSEGQVKGFKILVPNRATPGLNSTESSFSWSPDGKKILAPTKMEGDVNIQLYMLDPEAKAPPRKLPGQDPNCRNFCSSWSPDGKKIALAFWPGNSTEKKEQPKSLLQRFFGAQ